MGLLCSGSSHAQVPLNNFFLEKEVISRTSLNGIFIKTGPIVVFFLIYKICTGNNFS